MDEDKQKEQQEMPDKVLEQGARLAAQGGKKVGKKLGEKGLQLLAKAAAKLAAQVVAFIVAHIVPILIILAIIVTLSVLFPAFDNFLDEDSAETIDEVTYQLVQDYCNVDETGVHFNKEEFLKNITIELANNGIDLNALGFGDDQNSLSDSNTILGNNIAPDSEAANYLYKFLSASMAGEFPYIEGSDEETQGIIKIKRRKDAGGMTDLTYIGYQQFKSMLSTTDSSQKDKMLTYFSLDQDWNLCVAKPFTRIERTYSQGVLTSEKTEYTISEVKIPYRNMVAQYTVPFMFLIDLQMITNNANYVEAVAELMTKQSEIEFTIFDDIATDTYEYTYEATEHTKTKHVEYPDQNTITNNTSTEPIVTYSYSEENIEEKTEIINITDNVKANVTKAKTWIIEQETNYEMQTMPTEYPYGENGKKEETKEEEPEEEGTWKDPIIERWYETIVKKQWVKSGNTKTVITPSEFMGLWSNETGTYVKGAPYKPVGDGKPGKVVKYRRLKGSNETDPIIINIVTAREQLYDLLELRPATRMHAELMKEMIKLYMSGEELTESSFATSAFTSVYEPFEYVEGSYVGNFDIHDESLFITDLEELKKALQLGYSKSAKLVANAEALLEMQETYKVNAIFAAAVSITETGAGYKGNAVNECKNWFNISGTNGPYKTVTTKKGETYHWRIYGSEQEGIKAFGNYIANGSHYYTKGIYTVAEIGAIYCPNTATHPTQADDWVESTLAQMSRFYEAVGIDISPIIESSGGVVSGDLKDLFPNGIPTTASEMQQYLTTITIDINDANGNKTTRSITVHKAVAEDVKTIFKEIQVSGFRIKSVGAYSWRSAAASTSRSHHSYGVAIDINPNENYMIKNGKIVSGSFWKPGGNEFSITPNGPVVQAFARRGWKWGGNWKSSKDYMHFSLTGH